ncbi:MAG: hypothetical protein ACRDFS_12030 [Chloroflexota bacterium]
MKLLVTALMGVALASAGWSAPARLDLPSGASSPPQALASRLGVHGSPHIGRQAEGIGGPWYIWYLKKQVLSSGRDGAGGIFDYYRPSLAGRDSFSGKGVTAGQAIAIAKRWLRHSGARIPPTQAKVVWGSGTVIGGTGICCFDHLAIVHWGGQVQLGGVVIGGTQVYVADRGTTVQADVGYRRGGGKWSAYPGSGARTTLRLGKRRFQYTWAAAETMTMDIGGHQPWMASPRQVAGSAAYVAKLVRSPGGQALHQVLLNRNKAIYTIRKHGSLYRFALVAAFPGLPGTAWEMISVTRH